MEKNTAPDTCPTAYIRGDTRWTCAGVADHPASSGFCTMVPSPLPALTTPAEALRYAAEVAEGAMWAGYVAPGSSEEAHNLACRQVAELLRAAVV